MQGFEKRHESGGLRRAEILAVRRHVAAALDYLADKLVLRQAYRNAIECRTALPATLSKSMAVTTLFDLKDKRTLPLERSRTVQEV
jgi:hypothetical protein